MDIPIRTRIDHTNYRPTATKKDILRLVDEAAASGFRSVCVNLGNISIARAHIDAIGATLELSGIVDFPLGASGFESKLHQAAHAKELGATELDTVINIASVLQGDHEALTREITQTNAILPTKFIIEHMLLSDEQVLMLARLLADNGAFCLKLATGFIPSPHELKLHHIRIVRESFPDLKIKASGGIRTLNEITELIDTGADFIGTSGAHDIFGVTVASSPSSQ